MLDLVDKRILKRYLVKAEIAKGSNSIIYRAIDRESGGDVALKFLDAGYADPDEFFQFVQQSVRPLTELKHENIVSYHTVERYLNSTFIVMDFITGISLRTLIEEHPTGLPIPEALSLLSQITSGLRYMHQHGLAHQDVRPANVMITSDYHAYLIDLKLPSGARMGTVGRVDLSGAAAYLAPERWQDLTQPGDQRGDIYALGITTYELLCGQRPYRGDSVNAAGERSMTRRMQMEHFNAPLPSLRSVRAELPEAIDAVIARATSKLADARPRDATEFYQEVKTALSGTIETADDDAAPTFAQPAQTSQRSGGGVLRYLIAIVLILGAAAGIALSIWGSLPEQDETPTATLLAAAASQTANALMPTETPSATATETSTPTPSETPTETPTSTATPTQTVTPSRTPTGTATLTLRPSLTPFATERPDITATVTGGGLAINTSVFASAGAQVNIRSGPGENFSVVSRLTPNTPIEANGISVDGLWVRVTNRGLGIDRGWISADLVRLSTAQRAQLPVIDLDN